MKFRYIFILLILASLLICSCGKKQDNKDDNKNLPNLDTEYQIMYFLDDEYIGEEFVKEGNNATPPVVTKDGYNFIGWDQDLTNIHSDLMVYAIMEEITFKVKFMDGSTLLKEQDVKLHGHAVAPLVSNIEGKEVSWDKSYSDVTSDLVVNLILTPLKFEVIFYGLNNVELSVQQVEYASSAISPNPPVIDNYEFVSWDKDFSCIKERTYVYANYNKLYGTISYVFNGNTLNLSPASYEVGKTLKLPTLTEDGYEFLGWTLSSLSLTFYDEIDSSMDGDYIFYAKVKETSIHNQIVLPEASDHFTQVNFIPYSTGSYLNLYSMPIPSTAIPGATNYNWTTSDSSVALISEFGSLRAVGTGFCIVTATAKENKNYIINAVIKVDGEGVYLSSEEEANTINLVTATFVDKDDNVIYTEKTLKGGNVTCPIPPTVEGYRFIGWDHANYNIKEDTTFKPIYEVGIAKYQGKSFAIIGDSISTYSLYIPEGYSYFYPYATADFYDFNCCWWMQVINKLGGTLFVNNSYSGSCVSNKGSKASTMYMERCESTVLQGEAPDVILIFMCSNDASTTTGTSATFLNGYRQMLNNLKELAPDSEVILITPPLTNLTDSDDVITFKAGISQMGEEYNYQVIDMSSLNFVYDESIGIRYLLDSAHFNLLGQTKFAEKIYTTLLD